MKDRYKISVISLYVLAFLILFFCTYTKFIPYFYIDIKAKIPLLLIACIFIYIAGYILIRKLNYNKKILKANLVVYFLIYIYIIFSLTLFDEIYGRNGFILIDWNKNLFNYYFNNSVNLIPLNTIKLFIRGYINEVVSLKSFLSNIFGNLLAFMPCSIFITLLFKSINKYYKFLIIMISSVMIIEVLQFVTLSGSCDIDDLILNVLGASIIYFIIKIKCITRFLHRIFLFE